jgi:hypothetical protein
MTRISRLLAVGGACLFAVACATTTFEAVSDFDNSYDFTAVRRIAILPIDRTSAAERLISDMQVGRIDAALAEELQSRGFTVVEDREDADVYLSWHLVTRERTDIRSYNASSAYQCWRCGPPVSDVSVRQYTEGTFIVDMIDPLRNRSVWRSTIQSRLSDKPDPQQAEQRRAAAAKAVLAPFPPQADGAG